MKIARVLTLLPVVFVLLVVGTLPAMAHEGREVGPFEIEVGWRVEPAYTGILNGPEIQISRHETGEPVLGAEATLQVEVQFGPETRLLPLEPVPDIPGRYTAMIIPTLPGDYTFHLVGAIEETPVDEVFSSADGQIATIEPISDLEFPESNVSLQALLNRIEELEARITTLETK